MEGLRQSPAVLIFLSLLPLLWAPSRGQLATRGEAPEGGGRVKAAKKGRGWTAIITDFSTLPVFVTQDGDPAVNGSTVTLVCNGQPDLHMAASYSWYRETADSVGPGRGGSGSGSASGAPAIGPDVELVSNEQNLTFSPFVFGDEGVYYCEIDSSLLSDPYTLYSECLFTTHTHARAYTHTHTSHHTHNVLFSLFSQYLLKEVCL